MSIAKLLGLIVLGVVVFVGAEVVIAQHRFAIFEKIVIGENQTAVIKKLGKPFNAFNCKNGGPSSALIYTDNMCNSSEEIVEVYAFEHCAISEFIAPGWFNVSFGADGRVVSKYSIESP